ncbi:hypothetical protein FA95DRAFT_116500 [Auriscalpium vulgare]|uniref:Uncharacterized protein n=1 Tax=Auriscalpium vulgare TaxID=40419 RepID=A0ACB8RPJ1_9AGAM|nr:hypothetical protein FA95DRAFT_116500 [Auriscalpium vulgare]
MPAKRKLTGAAAASVAKKIFLETSATAPPLQYDVHVEIIEWVYRASQHANVDYQTLSACSLVCKAWAPPSQRLLFRRTWIMEPGSTKRISQLFLSIRRNPLLGTYVRTLAIAVANIFLFPIHYADDGKVLTLFSLCPNITGLAIYPNHIFNMSNLVQNLSRLDLRIKVLRIIGRFDSVGPLIDLWPDLTCLDIIPDSHSTLSPPTPSKFTRAVAIRWNGRPTWVFPRIPDALREVEVCDAWVNPSGLDRFMDTSALENITSLVLDGAVPSKSVLDRCPKLETLVFAVCPAVSTSLPVTLRHVGYHACTATRLITVDVQHLVEALRALPILELVTATRALSKRTLAKLKRGCTLPGVEFATYGDARMFKRVVDADSI